MHDIIKMFIKMFNGKSRGFLISGGILAALAAIPFIGTIATIFLGGAAVAGSAWMISQVIDSLLITILFLGGAVVALFFGLFSSWTTIKATPHGLVTARSYKPFILIIMSIVLFGVYWMITHPGTGGEAMAISALGADPSVASDIGMLNILMPVFIVISIVSVILIVLIMFEKPKKRKRRKRRRR